MAKDKATEVKPITELLTDLAKAETVLAPEHPRCDVTRAADLAGTRLADQVPRPQAEVLGHLVSAPAPQRQM